MHFNDDGELVVGPFPGKLEAGCGFPGSLLYMSNVDDTAHVADLVHGLLMLHVALALTVLIWRLRNIVQATGENRCCSSSGY